MESYCLVNIYLDKFIRIISTMKISVIAGGKYNFLAIMQFIIRIKLLERCHGVCIIYVRFAQADKQIS